MAFANMKSCDIIQSSPQGPYLIQTTKPPFCKLIYMISTKRLKKRHLSANKQLSYQSNKML